METKLSNLLLDTSVLVALSKPIVERTQRLIEFMERYKRQDAQFLVAPQCLFEFYAVATRPVDVNGLGLRPDNARKLISKHLSNFELYLDTTERQIYGHWIEIVEAYRVSGRPAHDARLVAWMLANGVGRILTLNPKDFVRYQPQIEVLTVDATDAP